ncbi:MAG: 4-alpha-glucanotransferase, partial [Lysobacterales bacterium]
MSSLEALARRCGISLTRSDTRGERRVSRETLEFILGALGHAANSDERAAESLAALERRVWQSVLPPVVVAREREAAVELALPQATRIVSWHLLCDDGTQRTGEAAFADLPLVARDHEGESRPGRRKERRRLSLGALPIGYHSFSVEPHGASCAVVVTPPRCFLPSVEEGKGLWGLALQLYLARSERNFGSGDFGDLAALTADIARRGCDVV